MESLTKVAPTVAEIAALAKAAFGARTRVATARAIDEGWYNAGFALELEGSGPARAFLKVAPPPGVPVLIYEHQLMRAEAANLQALAQAGVPHVPAVLATDFSGRIVAGDCLFMAWADGVMLSEARPAMADEERVCVRREIGFACGLANRIESAAFGYPAQPALQATSWRDAFGRMVAGLLDDARRFGAPLAEPVAALSARFQRAADVLDGPSRPGLAHYDLWDNNVIVRQGPDGWRLSGVVDWERGFFGDPLADVIALTAVGGPGEREAALAGQAEGRGEAFAFDDSDRRRLALYRAYLWLIMIVEAVPRGFGGSIRLPVSSAARRLERDLAAAA